MTQNPNPRHRDKEAYRYYLHDGLYDILAGLSLLSAGFYLLTDLSAAFVAIWVVLWLPLWRSSRKSIVAPRVRDLDVSQEQSASARRAGVLLVVIVAGILLLVGVAPLLGEHTGQIPDWILTLLHHYFILGLGLLGAITLGIAAWLSRLNRLYAYGLVTVAVCGVGYLINVPIPLAVAVVGSVITLWGLIMLVRFVRKHPPRQT